MNKSTVKTITIYPESEVDEFYRFLKENLGERTFEINKKKFLGNINGNEIEIERKHLYYQNYKAIKFFGEIGTSNDKTFVQGYFITYYFMNFIIPIIMIILFITIGALILNVSIHEPFFIFMCLGGLLYLSLTLSIASYLIWKDKKQITEFLLSKK